MSKSKFEYVRKFELDDRLVPNCWIVVRVDGKGFHRFSEQHSFSKPNDVSALNLMVAAARGVMAEFPDILVGYGQSDEFSFVFRKDTDLYGRRSAKIVSTVASLFTSHYVVAWPRFFPSTPLAAPPAFDGRAVLYASNKNMRDYLSWRQADCHINNLYNTAFWSLVQRGGLTAREAEQRLSGTVSSDKNELLFSQFGLNYNDELEQFRKGTTLFRKKVSLPSDGGGVVAKVRSQIVETTGDIIADDFWRENAHVLKPFEEDGRGGGDS